jgi:hypothetical protein
MDADFPAAHSMDTWWFAVDAEGHVAVFDSGEAGAVPIAALSALSNSSGPPVMTALTTLLSPGLTRWEPSTLGLFSYEHPLRFERLLQSELLLNQEGPRVSGPYVRLSVPERPLHVDQLPPPVRAVVTSVRFNRLTFAEERAIQPAEQTPCASEQPDFLTLGGERKPFPPGTPTRPS